MAAEQEIIEIRVEGAREEESSTEEEQNRINRREFKRFDILPAADNNHYYYATSSTSLSNYQKLSKKIMKEWKILEQNLPDSIFVRVYESRIDLIRAVIIGAAGTPYHDGLFFFDIQFPSDYPDQPPELYYHSFGYRLNPNLYGNGKVCLSLLNTWLVATKDEKWNPSKSTVLQILLSIQALVLNSKPYFNEPLLGYLGHWNQVSLAYNQDVFVLSCKTMLALLNTPPKHFEEFVSQHFRDRAETILIACKAYIEGRVRVGGAVTSTTTSAVVAANAKTKFQKSMMFINSKLVKAFMKNGSSSLENYVGDNIDENENDLHETTAGGQTMGLCCCLLLLLVFVLLICAITAAIYTDVSPFKIMGAFVKDKKKQYLQILKQGFLL